MDNNKLTRFGVSMDEKLLQKFDDLVEQRSYQNRSEAIRDLVREAILQQTYSDNSEYVAGTILLFYAHHQNGLVNEMMNIQHDYHDQILTTTHLHIDHNNCLEVIVVKGLAHQLKQLSDQLIALKGVFYGKLTVSPLS
ncbi:MAG: nickel-responsive transcriptional regulator NikR [Candidatus Pristimantibacillus lignocellulolyticus]|uniref:Putative nickel-responsive regulator n=1 Tax=Candidatus Pristimantibacillus lignocellulolyticus TaxID=2994561 RepID=A0A9J6ZCR8_9BACL|nr:MAG: nickel-responsive transcriptional regulator NikR [Candidatus Pristimantibacillus lignocellulolyticus]